MGERERRRAQTTKTGPARSRVQAAAETAAKAGRALAGVADPRAKPGARRKPSPEGEIRALKRTVAEADARLRAAEVRFARAQARLSARHERENEALEAQLTKLVQELGAAKHLVDRAHAREADLRLAVARIDELTARESAWEEERSALLADLARARGGEIAAAAALVETTDEPASAPSLARVAIAGAAAGAGGAQARGKGA